MEVFSNTKGSLSQEVLRRKSIWSQRCFKTQLVPEITKFQLNLDLNTLELLQQSEIALFIRWDGNVKLRSFQKNITKSWLGLELQGLESIKNQFIQMLGLSLLFRNMIGLLFLLLQQKTVLMLIWHLCFIYEKELNFLKTWDLNMSFKTGFYLKKHLDLISIPLGLSLRNTLDLRWLWLKPKIPQCNLLQGVAKGIHLKENSRPRRIWVWKEVENAFR